MLGADAQIRPQSAPDKEIAAGGRGSLPPGLASIGVEAVWAGAVAGGLVGMAPPEVQVPAMGVASAGRAKTLTSIGQSGAGRL